jgi:DNA repair exonuclease SbcCD ATPase subunit
MILLRSLHVPAFKHLQQIELYFPRSGSVLIEGPNESGKSTLFEAIYFALYGAPLVGEEGQGGPSARAALASLLPYGGQSASVALALVTDTAELEIERTLTASRRAGQQSRHEARLLVRRTGAPVEEVRGPGAVNARVVSELHGLDGDAMRNSCFMEQGALDRVEVLSRAARDDAIAKLLGLERLVGIERDLKPSAEDQEQVELARIELLVAKRSREATEAAGREAEAEAALRAARVRALVAQRDSLDAQLADHATQGTAMQTRTAELDGHIARAGRIAALLAALDATEPHLATGRAAEASANQVRGRQAQLDRIEREEIPAAEARIAELRALETDLAGAEEARVALPGALQLQRVAELDARLSRLDQLVPALGAYEAAERELAQAQEAYRLERAETAARTAVQEAQAALDQAEGKARTAQAAVDRANVRDMLAYWVRLKEIEMLKRGERHIADLTARRDTLAQRMKRLHRREMLAATLSFIFALVALGAAIAGLTGRGAVYFIVTGVATPLVWISAIVFVFALLGGRRIERRLGDAEQRLTLASIRSEAANMLTGSVEDLPQVEDDLRAAGAAVPENIEVGRASLASLTATEPTQLADLEERTRDLVVEAERRRMELTAAQTQLATAERERTARNVWLDASGAEIERRLIAAQQAAATAEATARGLLIEPFAWPIERVAVQAANTELATQRVQAAEGLNIGIDEPVDLEQARHAVAEIQARLRQHTDAAQARLAALQLPADPSAIAAARGATEAELARLHARLNAREALAAELETHAAGAEEARATLSPAARQAWRDAVVLAVLAADAQPSDHADVETVARDRATLRAAANTTLDALDERSARDELATLRARLAAHGDRGGALTELREAAVRHIRKLHGEYGLSVTGDESLETLAAAWPMLTQVGPDEVETREQEVASASREAHFARRTADELARQHGFDATRLAALDEAECRERVAEGERILRQRELATSLAREVRTRIVRRVLPETAVYMRALLPELTAGRYRDVQLLRDERDPAGADLRIRVWDQAAGRYVGKSLFSGGARDQASLALRLAFALATLPKETGAAPGFVFLDEPLSAFDAERSQALVHVLTDGAIARTFAQIFLISHGQSFDPSSFRYALQLENGAIVDSTLPGESEAAAQWQAEAVRAAGKAANG